MLSTPLNYRLISADIQGSIDLVAARPQVNREVEYYRENIGNVKTIDDFMGDARLVNFAMSAHGMEDISYAKGLIRKVLEEGIDDNTALANRLADRRYTEFVETFNFVRYDTATTSFDRATEGTVDKYLRQALEVDAGQQGEGVRLALYFERKAGSIESAYDILSDRALLDVTRTALGLPASISATAIDRQASLLDEKLDYEDFQSPEKVQEFLDRFATLWDLENPQSGPASSVAALFNSQPTFGLSESILTAIQSLNSRRR